ncbi:ribonuclease H-like domain-containing protein [Tanacetum coccineum]
MKFNNKDAARFDKGKVKCYKCSELGHFARECTGKQVDSKARYSSFKLQELNKGEETKALLSVDSMVNWSDHEGEDVEISAAQVYGMIAGAKEDATGDVADDVSNDAAEFALMGALIPASVPTGSRNRQTSVPTGSRNRRTSVPASRPFSVDGEKMLLLSPQQVVLGEFKDHICNGDPRTMVVLRIPRRHNLYCFNLSDIQPERDVTCLLAKASLEESTKWHRRMAHVNFKNMNKLAKHGLVNGTTLQTSSQYEHNCVACNKGKQHKSSYKAITAGIRRDYSNARTPQQNGVAERNNRTLIEAARTMLADSMLPTMKFEGKADEGFMLGTKVNEASDMVESSSDYAEELARLQKQAYEANATAEKHLSQADLATSRNRVPAGKVVSAADVTDGLVTTKEKVQKKNDVKARSMLLMALPNEHLMIFNQYKDAKTLFAAIQTRFGGNEATKKTSEDCKSAGYPGNKPDLDTMSFDDLYNNFKIVEQEVKGTASSSSSSQNMAFVSSPSSTNEVNTAYGVSTANTQVSPAGTQVSTASTQVSTANLSDDTKTGRKITINRSDTTGYDMSKVECFNCHKIGYFSRECRGPRNQDNQNKNQDSSRRTINVEETSSKAMVAIDGAGFDWSYMADDEVPTNMALMTFSNSEFNLATYKRGLAFVEEQLIFYKKNEVIFCEQLAVLKRDISYKDPEISMLKCELEKLKQEKESNQLKIEKIDNASKSLDKLIGSQIPDKSRKGVGFPEFEGYGPKTSTSVSEDISNEVRESPDTPLVKKLMSDDKLEKKTVSPTVAKIEFVRPKQQEKPVRKPVKYAEMYRSQSPRGNQRNWNNQKSQQLGSDCDGHLQKEDQGYVDSGCSRHMTGNISYLSDFKEFDGGYVTFRGGAKGRKITGKGTIKTTDESHVLLKVPRKNNIYSVDMKNIVPKESLTCLVTKATLDKSMLWHRRLGHVNFKTINKLVKENRVRGLPIKRFENDQTYVACLKGKQHKASSSKDETSGILKSFITEIENLVDKKVKIIRCDNGTEFKNRVMSEFCKKKGIKKEFSVARTPQQNGVAERRNRTLIEAARTIGRTPTLSFMRTFGCHVTILNTLDYLGKFDEKSDEGFFVGYLMNSKAFRVYNIRTRKVEESLHIRFLEDKPIIASTNSNDLVDGSLFDSSSKNASNDEPQASSDAGKKDDEGVNKESGIDDQERPKNSTQDVNTAGPSINTASTYNNVGSLNINTVSPTVNTAPLEATHADFFRDETEINMSNITTTYLVPSTLNTRIHKDHSLDHVIGDV